MTFEEIEAIARPMLSISDEAAKKRIKFKESGRKDFEEQSLGEALGASKCILTLVELYPEEMKIIMEPVIT